MGRVLTLVCLVAMASPAVATTPPDEVEGVRFARRIEVSGRELTLHAVGRFRWKRLVRVYAGALYRGARVAPRELLDDVPKRLEIEYFRGFSADDFVRSTEGLIRRNMGADVAARLAPEIAALNGLYRAVEPGDRYALTYLPGRGLTLALNDRELGTIPGEQFARAVFSMWLGPDPLDRSFRDELLAGVADELAGR